VIVIDLGLDKEVVIVVVVVVVVVVVIGKNLVGKPSIIF